MLSGLRKILGGWLGQSLPVAPILLALALGLNLWQHSTVSDLREWQQATLRSLAQAVDQHDARGALKPVRASDAQGHIAALGRLKADYGATREKARADDAEHVLMAERQTADINRKGQNDYLDRIGRIRADAASLLASAAGGPAAGGLRTGRGTAAGGGRDGGTAAVPVLSDAGPGADEASGPDGFSASVACGSMTIAERLLASEQAIQLDQLISGIEAFAAADRNLRGKPDGDAAQ